MVAEWTLRDCRSYEHHLAIHLRRLETIMLGHTHESMSARALIHRNAMASCNSRSCGQCLH
jgi:hypothetical protein